MTAGAGVHVSGATGLRVLNRRFSNLEGEGIYMQRALGYEVIGNEIDSIYDVGGDPGGDCIQVLGKTGYSSNNFVISNNIVRRESKETNQGNASLRNLELVVSSQAIMCIKDVLVSHAISVMS